MATDISRWHEAEEAYRAALASGDNSEIREKLALALLKQDRPQDAEPLLKHILDQKLTENAGSIYVLVQGYQAQGLHDEALDVMDRRDEAFPQWAGDKDYKAQRKLSERYRSSGKKIRSAFLSESAQAGYREGGKGRLFRLIGPLVLLGLVGVYLAAAAIGGHSRKVFLVNGLNKPYAVAVNGKEHKLTPNGATPIEIPEGDVQVEFRDPEVSGDPIQLQIETPFFSRPFLNRTFVLNPDRLAVLIQEQVEYSATPVNTNLPYKLLVGESLYVLDGIDYPFVDFPPTLEVKQNQTIQKSRIGIVPLRDSQQRFEMVARTVDPRSDLNTGSTG